MHHRWIIFLLAVSGILNAGNLYLTPNGSGAKTGTSWDSALDQDSINRAINEILLPGDTLNIGSGTYQNLTITIHRGGNKQHPKTIRGVDQGNGLPVIQGTWSVTTPNKGASAIRFSSKVNDVIISNLRIEHYKIGIHLPHDPQTPPRKRLTFRGININQIRHGFYLSDCHDLQIEDCDLVRYSKHGFRFERGCSRVRADHCVADCSGGSQAWEQRTELFPFGFFVNHSQQPQADFLFTDCVARNNLMPLQNRKYKNGDGFVIEKSAVRVRFVRCQAIRNQDGGFDLKSPDVSLDRCIAKENPRGFRIWNTGSLNNCFSGSGKVGLWSNGGQIKVSRTTFHQLSDTAVLADDDCTGPVELNRCVITECNKIRRSTAKGKIRLHETISPKPTP